MGCCRCRSCDFSCVVGLDVPVGAPDGGGMPAKFDGDVVTDIRFDLLGLVPPGNGSFRDSTNSGDHVAVKFLYWFANIGGDSFEEWGERYGGGYWEPVGSFAVASVFSLCFDAAGTAASFGVASPGAVLHWALGDRLQHFSDGLALAAFVCCAVGAVCVGAGFTSTSFVVSAACSVFHFMFFLVLLVGSRR